MSVGVQALKNRLAAVVVFVVVAVVAAAAAGCLQGRAWARLLLGR
ncbi:hypothetical protein [Xylella fastidiosa]